MHVLALLSTTTGELSRRNGALRQKVLLRKCCGKALFQKLTPLAHCDPTLMNALPTRPTWPALKRSTVRVLGKPSKPSIYTCGWRRSHHLRNPLTPRLDRRGFCSGRGRPNEVLEASSNLAAICVIQIGSVSPPFDGPLLAVSTPVFLAEELLEKTTPKRPNILRKNNPEKTKHRQLLGRETTAENASLNFDS